MIIAIILTAFVYLVLQRIDDNRRERNGQPPAPWSSRLGLLFFVAIVCFVATFLFENMGAEGAEGSSNSAYVEGGGYEDAMLESIREPIHVGLPPF